MAPTYTNVYLAADATASSDCYNSCFSSRSPSLESSRLQSWADRRILQPSCRRSINHAVFDRADNDAFELVNRDLSYYLLSDQPHLSRRGWCFQDRLLNGRVLHFGATDGYAAAWAWRIAIRDGVVPDGYAAFYTMLDRRSWD